MPMIDKTSRRPIYEQIVESLEREIAAGLLKENEKLPSVRELSVLLDANPNTVQKAFAELDRAGLIVSYPGRGCFVSEPDKGIKTREEILSSLSALITAAKEAGIEKDEIEKLTCSIYNEESHVSKEEN